MNFLILAASQAQAFGNFLKFERLSTPPPPLAGRMPHSLPVFQYEETDDNFTIPDEAYTGLRF